jgi:peptidoglycan/LPS O-acetylase OafA/YrhL
MLPAARLLVRGPGSDELFGGGLNLPAALFAFWEPLVAWGIIAGLLLFFRAHLNIASPVWDWFGRRAYAVYVLHTPVLVALALLISKWHASPMSKFMAVGTLGCIATWVAADALLRLPGVQRIL